MIEIGNVCEDCANVINNPFPEKMSSERLVEVDDCIEHFKIKHQVRSLRAERWRNQTGFTPCECCRSYEPGPRYRAYGSKRLKAF